MMQFAPPPCPPSSPLFKAFHRGANPSVGVLPDLNPSRPDTLDPEDLDNQPAPGGQRVRTLFISDLHLGTPGCQAEALLAFLKAYPSERLYLLGDIIDGWQLRRRWYWPQSHNDVVQKILKRARKGCKVVFIPGNHDAGLRAYCGTSFGNIEIRQNAVHVTASGKRYLVTHGDEFDVVVNRAHWLALLGDRSYAMLLALNRPFNAVRRSMGMEYWSIAA
ncbi:MAG: UDP-2,3-diacylglucosamine diphosphatase, partial [Burkholderiaceae bacterium]|nr:UDP-2,3-diacylglucosamine diphosphatase [Burkholderiaceae bacterium]